MQRDIAQVIRVTWISVVASLVACAPSARKPMDQPVEAMAASWGPFARQCATTWVTSPKIRAHPPNEVTDAYRTCIGFLAMYVSPNATEITASEGEPDRPSSMRVLRMVRDTRGVARSAQPGDTGLLAQGSDSPEAAATLARDIGLTERQFISRDQSLELPIHLSIPFPLDAMLLCHPEGEYRDHDRDTLVFSCALDQHLRTDRLDARVQLAGTEQIDVLTGVRLSSTLSGNLHGRTRTGAANSWLTADDQLRYRREMDFE